MARMKIRSQLFVLVIAALLPVALFAGVMTARLWQLQRDAYEQRFLERVRALRIALDTELGATVRTLDALAVHELLAEERRTELDERVEGALRTETGWATVGAVAPDGRTLLHVRHPDFDVEAAPDAKTIAAVIASRAPVMSDLLATDGGRRWLTFVAVPVLHDGTVAAVFYAGIEHAAWLALLRRYPIADQATLTLSDRNGAIIARTLNDDRWVGKMTSRAFLDRPRSEPEAAFVTTGLEGQSLYSVFSRSPQSGWTLGTGVPSADMEQALLGSTLLTAGGVATAMLLALLLAFVFGRRIALAVTSLAATARSLADPDPAARPRDPAWARIAEIETVRSALLNSGARLRERQDAADAALAREAKARADAEHANLAKDQFLAMLGHELRSPLSAISNASELLDRVAPDSDTATRGRAMIRRQTQHLTQIVNDLLDVARITSGKVVLSKHVVDLAVIVVHAVEALKDAGRFGKLTLDMRVEHAPVLGDETRLEQISTNLVENACKYTPAGGHVTVRVGVEGDAAVLEVADNGAGIAPGLMPHVFELFVQGEQTLERAPGGLGLGLPVVRRLVELHGGTVTATSEGEGAGARFTVRLPRSSGHVADEPAPAARPAPPSLRIVVVEDHADTRESLCILLEQDGHRVEAADDGPTGFARIVDELPDVALVDIGMPGFDGMELARRLSAVPGGAAAALVALSGYGGGDDRDRALAAGFDHYLVKPFDVAAFRAWLATRADVGRASATPSHA